MLRPRAATRWACATTTSHSATGRKIGGAAEVYRTGLYRTRVTLNMNDSPARIDPPPTETALDRPTATARRLVDASISPNTRRAYVADLHDAGRASSSASMAVAAACFRAKLAGQPNPSGERTARVLAGYRRTAGERGRGQAGPFSASDLAAVLATCHRSRRRGRGIESDEVAAERGRVDAVIAGLLFIGRDAPQRGVGAALVRRGRRHRRRRRAGPGSDLCDGRVLRIDLQYRRARSRHARAEALQHGVRQGGLLAG